MYKFYSLASTERKSLLQHILDAFNIKIEIKTNQGTKNVQK